VEIREDLASRTQAVKVVPVPMLLVDPVVEQDKMDGLAVVAAVEVPLLFMTQ
tara:strand:- start:265 stop:420 length:156 start_codon:yes stop_codon:yes gene_type:complete